MIKNWKNFKEHELVCSHCGEFNPNQEFQLLMNRVQQMRNELGFPMSVSSGYRCKDHPIEKAKSVAGQHSIAAIDLRVSYNRAYQVLNKALEMGFTGIGVNQKGDPNTRFIHLDLRESPTVWSY